MVDLSGVASDTVGRLDMTSNTCTASVKFNFEMLLGQDTVNVRIGSAIMGTVTKSGYGTPGIPAEVFNAARRFAGWNDSAVLGVV